MSPPTKHPYQTVQANSPVLIPSRRYPEVAQVLTDYFIQHRKDGQVISAAPEWVRKLSSGQYADRVSVFGGVFARLLVVSDYNQASPSYHQRVGRYNI